MTYGLLSTGFNRKPDSVILEEVRALWRGQYGASIDVSDTSPDGQLIGIWTEREDSIWQLVEAVYNANTEAAEDTALDQYCLMTGTFREQARRSTVTQTATGDVATVVAAGSQVGTASTGKVFEFVANCTIEALDAWTASTSYALGDRVTNDDAAWVCNTAGVSAGSGGPLTSGLTPADVTDGTAHWMYLGDGVGAVDGLVSCTETGPTVALAGDLTEIITPALGWLGTANVADATLGNDRTSNQGLRLLRKAELSASGGASVPGLRGKILRDVPGVTTCTVFYNYTDTVDADGIPAHAIEVLVQGGDDDAIRAALHANVGGVGTHGTTSGTVTDSQGTVHTYKFSRPTAVPIYVIINVDVVAADFPSDGADQIETAIVAWGDAGALGANAVSRRIGANAFDVEGVHDVPTCYIGTAPAPATETAVPITSRQLATYSDTRITVNVTPVAP